MLVAGWPPVSLLLAVELLTHREKVSVPETTAETAETVSTPQRVTAEEVMWQHFQQEYGQGRIPTGAELDRVAGTHNYGRAVLRRWRRTGRIGTPLGLAPSPTEVETREDRAG